MMVAARHTYGTVLEGKGTAGRLGSLYDVLFDDQSWQVRHLVVSIDRWFYGRQVLIDPSAVERAEWQERKLLVRMTREQIRHSPRADTDLPVSRGRDTDAAKILVWEAYWTGAPRCVGGTGGRPAPEEYEGADRPAHPLHRRHVGSR